MKEEIQKYTEQCLNCKIKPCSNKGCPLQNNIPEFIKLLKEILLYLDPNYNKTITNFAKYKNLLFISSKYLEL